MGSKRDLSSLKEYKQIKKDLQFLKASVEKLIAENIKLREENQKQKELNGVLQRMLFGQKSEKAVFMHPDQLLLFEQKTGDDKKTEQQEVKVSIPEHERKPRKKRGAGKELPIVIEVIDLPEAKKIGADGKPRLQIGYIDTDKLEYIPEKLYIRRIRRLKYLSTAGPGSNEQVAFSVPALPPEIAPKSLFTPSLLAYLIVTKFLDALPLNRMERRFKRYGYLLSRATMVHGLLNVAKKCEVLVELLLGELLRGNFLLMDETPFQVHGEHGRANKSNSYCWVMYGGPPDKPIYIFKYHPERSQKIPLLYLKSYKGFYKPMDLRLMLLLLMIYQT